MGPNLKAKFAFFVLAGPANSAQDPRKNRQVKLPIDNKSRSL